MATVGIKGLIFYRLLELGRFIASYSAKNIVPVTTW